MTDEAMMTGEPTGVKRPDDHNPPVPYKGFPETPCPKCGGSVVMPWRRWPACSLCNPLTKP